MSTLKNLGIKGDFKLKLLVGVHEREREDDRVKLHYYLTAHDVDQQNGTGKVLVGQGRPLTESALFQVGLFLANRTPDKTFRRGGMIPPNLLYLDCETQKYVWSKPSHRSKVLFSSDSHLSNQEMIHPHLIFVCHSSNFYIYACMDEEPKPESILFRAPYLNIFESENNLCKGSASMAGVKRSTTHTQLLQAWENLFFLSKFSHGAGKLIPHTGKQDNKAYMAMLHKAERFPYSTLIKTKLKLKDICQ